MVFRGQEVLGWAPTADIRRRPADDENRHPLSIEDGKFAQSIDILVSKCYILIGRR